MKKLILTGTVLGASVWLSGCTVSQTTYTTPAYTRDYVYSVGYYGYRPYWGGSYYNSYNWGHPYWGGSRPYWRNVYYGHGWYGRHW
ncbi:hypothetical protein Lbir_3104 [Legionella birminghamensis]|uniref:Lipoprotein n=1 Tax=Legionella birminghamensis TaxID=28083 RepID=A0A378IE67_9GAMM|nr:hypothetical protein Lbir_3104 [Legionella birminghamensis]STX33042.1 Uncharacterised protein [Legionella birminghamensis]